MNEDLAGPFRVAGFSACKDVARGVPELRPGMDRDMRLGQQGERGHALWFEAMRNIVEEGGTGFLSRIA